jgi:beta-phosphoglucomutase-like phosphatase (HAD superfamily)
VSTLGVPAASAGPTAGDLDLSAVTTLLCDADGTLFPSEDPAYAASATVTNRFLDEIGAGRSYSAAELQDMTHGQNFRATAALLARLHDRPLPAEVHEHWVAEERDVVTRHLREVLRPDRAVSEPVMSLSTRYLLAVVTSSAGCRLDACLEMTGLAPCFEPSRRFSAETSLPTPRSKPDPAVYTFACERLGIEAREGLAIEDSVTGARSALAAGVPTIGIVQFVRSSERSARIAALRDAGALAVVSSWAGVVDLLDAAAVQA